MPVGEEQKDQNGKQERSAMPVSYDQSQGNQQNYRAQHQDDQWTPEDRRLYFIDINSHQCQRRVGRKKKWIQRDKLQLLKPG